MESTVIKTESVPGETNGVIYNEDMSEELELVVPYKFYRLTELTVWVDNWRFSGLQMRFEALPEFTGYAPIVFTAGSTRFASRF